MSGVMLSSFLLMPAGELKSQNEPPTLCQQLDSHSVVYFEIGSAVGKPKASGLSSQNFTAGQRINIKGSFEVDVPTSFNGCIVKADPGASVSVPSGSNISITNGARFFSCGEMWRGISITGGFAFVSGSTFEDAQVCFSQQSSLVGSTFINNTFNRNYIGIWLNVPTHKSGAGIYGNTFSFTSALNAPYTGQATMLGTGAPYCGIRLSGTTISIGRIDKNPNLFEGLQCGIFSERSTMILYNSQFRNMVNQGNHFAGLSGGCGITTVDGTTEVNLKNTLNRCVFEGNIRSAIRSYRTNLQVFWCDFSRNLTGVENINTLPGHRFLVKQCRFTDLGIVADNVHAGIVHGILYERSYAASISNILENNFETATQGNTGNLWVIHLIGLTADTESHLTRDNVFHNRLNHPVIFIKLDPGLADGFMIQRNKAYFLTINNHMTRHGISIGHGTGMGHYVKENEIYGGGEDISDLNYTCGIHIQSCPNIHICYNTTDGGLRGFHFLSNNNREEFIQNTIKNHTRGLEFDETGEIGIQVRTANRWPNAANPVGAWSAISLNPSYSASKLIVHSTDVEYFLTATIRSPADLFDYQQGILTSCQENAPPPVITDFDHSVADGTRTPLSALDGWENQHRVYYKLLRFPALVQTDSIVAAFYSHINSTSAGRYAQADYHYWRAAFAPSSIAQPLAQIQAALATKTDSLEIIYAGMTANDQDTVLHNQFDALAKEVTILSGQRAQAQTQVQAWVNASLDSLTSSLSGLPQTFAYEQARAGYLGLASKKMRGDTYSAADLAWLSGAVLSGEASIGFTAADASRLLPADDSLLSVDNYSSCHLDNGHRIQSGVAAPSLTPNLMLYPNPADEAVRFSASGFIENTQIFLYNAMGLPVIEVTGASEMNTQHLPSGAYFCVMQDAFGHIARQRLIIAH